MAGTSDDVSICISDEKLATVPSTDSMPVPIEEILPGEAERDDVCVPSPVINPCILNPCIFRVRDNVRSQNEKLYDPEILSIGPLHYGKDHLMKMEGHKLRFLNNLLNRRKKANADEYVKEIKSKEKEAREFYAETVKLDTDEFVEMLLLDGCFIIELIRKYGIPELANNDVTIFRNEQVLSQLRHDIVLIENQIPFFVLDKLFSMTKDENDPCDDIRGLFQLFIFNPSLPPDASQENEQAQDAPPEDEFHVRETYHLLGLLHEILCSSFPKRFSNPTPSKKPAEMLNINCATELHEAGVKFEKYTETLFLKIDFVGGVLKMPRFYVYDGTESFLRNMMAYERCFFDDQPKYLTDYAFLMKCLINSPKDVKILRCCGVITNFLGDDDMVYNLFNRFGTNIITPSHFCYSQIFSKVNDRYRSRGKKWKATLRNTYFNGPWKTIAFFASVLLLLLTIGQTVFLVLSYKKL